MVPDSLTDLYLQLSQFTVNHLGRICADHFVWHGAVDEVIAQASLLVHLVAILGVPFGIIWLPCYIRKGIVVVHCGSERKPTTARLKRSLGPYRIPTTLAAIVEVWSKNGSHLVWCFPI